MNIRIPHSQKGVAIYLTSFLMTLALGVGLGVGSVVVKQWNTTKDLGDSVAAYYAAETGIEQVLYEGRNGDDADTLRSNLISSGKTQVSLQNSSTGSMEIIDSTDASCSGDYYCILSRGTFESTSRAIRISR